MNFNTNKKEIFDTVPTSEKSITRAGLFALITASIITNKNTLDVSSSDDLSESDAGDSVNTAKINTKSTEEEEEEDLLDEIIMPSTSNPTKISENNIPFFLLRTYPSTTGTELEEDEEIPEWDDDMKMVPCACFHCKRRKSQNAC